MSKTIKNNQKSPFVLLILDGWGIAPKSPGNAIELAKKPNFDLLWQKYPHAKLQASGRFVGLPPSQFGNSEAGHMNIGAGRVIDQDAVFISKEINTGKFFKNPAFEAAYKHIVKNKSNFHIMGMLSNGQSAHSDPDHLLALLAWARLKKIKNVYLHLFTDGRDSPQHSALKTVEALMRQLKNKEVNGKLTGEVIATIIGRFYAMDRKKIWTRTISAYNAIVDGKGVAFVKSPQEGISRSYNANITDEFIKPFVIKRKGKIVPRISDNDAVIFFNLRSDRARQLAKPFVQQEFDQKNPGFMKRKRVLKNLVFVAMTDFGPDLDSILTAYPSADLISTLPMMLPASRQLYIAETEKYAHVTFFFNGGYDHPVNGETRINIPSPHTESYDKTPAMSTNQVNDKVISSLPDYDFTCANFASPDMVGHTGNLKACIKAIEAVDKNLGKIKEAVLKKGGTLLITADHGNAEKMLDLETGEVYTEHTGNPVPFILVSNRFKKIRLKKGKLGDIAPTILKLMKIKKPREMTGRELI
ncbi:MAG: 2,3-bisphosphoglycerate-independent phosphoglycerate mutase [Patescibacteria group bacterium]|jgi:2,3-bisphosphoglycerate-independent phosphoglycerate mutase